MRTARWTWTRCLLVAPLLLGATSCSEDPKFLTDEAACPGRTCTDDARARFDAISSLARVTEVESVARSNGLDSGTSSSAEVKARAANRREAREVALAVLAELDDWPGHRSSWSEVRVVADPERTVDYVARERLDLGVFEPCAPADCARAVDGVMGRLEGEVEGLSDVALDRRADGTLVVRGRAVAEQAELAARGVRRVFFDLGLQVADRLEVEVTARGPLEVGLRRQGGLVCEQPPGAALVSCDEDNSVPFNS